MGFRAPVRPVQLDESYGSVEHIQANLQPHTRRATLNTVAPFIPKKEKRTIGHANVPPLATPKSNCKMQTPMARTNVFQEPSRITKAQSFNPLLEIYAQRQISKRVLEPQSTNLYAGANPKPAVAINLQIAEQITSGLRSLSDRLLVFTSFACKCDFISLDHRSKLTRVQ